ncbi:MAG: metallopeptidase family protein [Armatimonadota bacterium]|nr:metallopeptidase family protein [Armatimonadota bacterium]
MTDPPMDEAAFEQLVSEALATVPADFQQYMENLQIIIQDRATPEQMQSVGLSPPHTLLGLYHGVPLTERGMYKPLMPDQITLFRVPLLERYGTGEGLRQQVRRTVLHEIAHFFGITDDRLHELDAY